MFYSYMGGEIVFLVHWDLGDVYQVLAETTEEIHLSTKIVWVHLADDKTVINNNINKIVKVT